MEKIKKLFLKYREIITYIIVGGLTTLVRWGTTAIFEDVFAFIKVDVTRSIIVTAVSLIVTILFAFPPNKLIVFESKSFKNAILVLCPPENSYKGRCFSSSVKPKCLIAASYSFSK